MNAGNPFHENRLRLNEMNLSFLSLEDMLQLNVVCKISHEYCKFYFKQKIYNFLHSYKNDKNLLFKFGFEDHQKIFHVIKYNLPKLFSYIKDQKIDHLSILSNNNMNIHSTGLGYYDPIVEKLDFEDFLDELGKNETLVFVNMNAFIQLYIRNDYEEKIKMLLKNHLTLENIYISDCNSRFINSIVFEKSRFNSMH